MLQAKKDKASSIIFHTRSNINFTLCDSSAKKIHMYISIFEFTRFGRMKGLLIQVLYSCHLGAWAINTLNE